MGDSSLTLKILKQVRDDVGEVKGKVDGLSSELNDFRSEVNERLDQHNERLEQNSERLDQNTARLGTVEHVVNELATQMAFVSRYVRNSGKRQTATEGKVEELTTRVTKLERRGGPKKP